MFHNLVSTGVFQLILFSDAVGFVHICSKISPIEPVSWVILVYTKVDQLITAQNLEGKPKIFFRLLVFSNPEHSDHGEHSGDRLTET